MPVWIAEYWKPALSVVSLVLSYPIFRVARTMIRVSRNQLALETCREDLLITTGRVKRLQEHLEDSGIVLSPESRDRQTNSLPPNEPNSTPH